jgi:hypothetical protein
VMLQLGLYGCVFGRIGAGPCDGGCWNWSAICRHCCWFLQLLALVGGCVRAIGLGAAMVAADVAVAEHC